jgi:hypothetical protein
MELSTLPDKSIEVKQTGYVAKLLDSVDYQSLHSTPSSQDFFDTADDSTIDYSKDATRFKSILMSLPFLAILTRPDILKEGSCLPETISYHWISSRYAIARNKI